MKFLADENLERSIVERLQEGGHDIAAASDRAGAPDPEVLSRALAEDRILLTNDKDFAELTFLQQKATAGIVLIRLPRLRGPEKAARVFEAVDGQGERLHGVFTVVEADAIRRRPFLSLKRRDP
ncbi:MAG TPA: DUF5615 family PIN-like protein [Thermoanaerobaculia bacterium]|jgi:predicted nuclease of predicted toxin-antitoxin system